MAGDWIKFELATMDKPEVLRIGRELGLSREAVVGHLIRFWGWFGNNSSNGHVDGVALRDVDLVMSLPGFGESLVNVGWLKLEGETSLLMPNFDRHNGESSKKRALTAKRQSRFRNADSNAIVTLDALPEKRREEKRIKDLKPLAQSDESLHAAESVNGYASIPLADKSEFHVPQLLLTELEAAYPAVDVESTLREIRAWCVANPEKRKTRRGAPRFLNRWFEKVQNHG